MRHRRHYTIDEARALLPWVTERLGAVRRAHERLTDADARRRLAEGAPGNGGGSAGKGVSEAFLELQEGMGAFERRDIVLRDVERGLIDFPALRDGREVYLCWIDGEADIAFWHDLDAGFAGRQPL
jgi:hypothetical protein